MQKTYTIGITGGSGSGKTFFINKLASFFTPSELCLVSQDHYYKPRELQALDERGIENFDLPESIDRETLLRDIQSLKAGKSVSKQEYTFNNPQVDPKILEIHPAPVIIIEGLFVQYFPEVERELDLKLFIEAKDYVKLSRRISRDKDERGYDLNDVLYRYENHVMPVYEALIKPLKREADLIIPNHKNFEQALHVIVQLIRAHQK